MYLVSLAKFGFDTAENEPCKMRNWLLLQVPKEKLVSCNTLSYLRTMSAFPVMDDSLVTNTLVQRSLTRLRTQKTCVELLSGREPGDEKYAEKLDCLERCAAAAEHSAESLTCVYP